MNEKIQRTENFSPSCFYLASRMSITALSISATIARLRYCAVSQLAGSTLHAMRLATDWDAHEGVVLSVDMAATLDSEKILSIMTAA